jgi:hypothetical protein
MTKAKENKEKSDEKILFPEIKVTVTTMKGKEKEYVVTPWSFGELIEVNPLIEEIFTQLEARGTVIDFASFDITTIKNIYFSVIPQLSKIIVSTVKITEDELKNLTVDSAIALASSIWNANKDSLGNILSPFFGPVGATEEEELLSEGKKDQA